ncbi:MAG: ribbon-helix-helix protein, CopG family [Vicinamibacterales bacterium]
MTPVTRTFTFALPEELKTGLQHVKERDGLTEAEQIRRAIRMWLESRGAIKAASQRAPTRRKA